MPRRGRDTQNWGTVSVGIITFATILVAATSAGIFAVSEELFGYEKTIYPEWMRLLVMILAMASLLAYLVVLVFGLPAIFRKTQAARRTAVSNAAGAVFVQSYTAVTAAVLIVLAQLSEEIQNLL